MREAGTWIYFHFPNFCDSIYVERALKDIGNKNEQEKLFEKV